jgi:hypothetical protein
MTFSHQALKKINFPNGAPPPAEASICKGLFVFRLE